MLHFEIIGPAYPLRGGIANYNERLAQEVQTQGQQAHLTTFKLQYPSILFPGKTQYSEDPPPANLDIDVTINSVNPVNWMRTGKQLKDQKPDLVIMKYWLPFLAPCYGTIARAVKKNNHTKVISILDNVIPHEKRPGDNALTAYFLTACDAFIYMSKSVGDDLAQFQTGKPSQFNPHPVYDNYGPQLSRKEAIAALDLDPDYRYLLFFGFVRRYKGLDLLLEAFADSRLREFPLKLIVAGEYYEDAAPYEAIIQKHQLEEKIIHENSFIPNERVGLYFSAADLIVQPYRDATQSGVTQIGYYYERPMIVTNVGGLPEIVPNGQAGYIVERTPESIADAINNFYLQDTTEQFVTFLKEEKKRYSWENLYATILELYQSLTPDIQG